MAKYRNTYADGWWDSQLDRLREMGGPADPETGWPQPLSMRRLAAHTGIPVGELRSRLRAYQGYQPR